MLAPRGARSDWRRRPILSASLRVLATLVPVVASVVVAFALYRIVPPASDTITAIGRALGLAACSLGALVVTDLLARRFLPLATLLQLSLVFPDQTPSRFKTALRSGSGRRMTREVALARREGISDDPTRAAEQLVMLATAMGDHDRRTRGHSERVRLYTELIAEELRLTRDERAKLQWAALIHDVGKIEVASEILNKKGRPDAAEWLILRGHPLAGERLAAPVEPWLGDAIHAIGGHHERWDGTGYPRGLAGADISRSAAIVAVADAFEVMTAVRSYKRAMPLAEARAEITRCAGTHFSPEVVRALLNVSIGRLRRSTGVLAAFAHVPFVGQAARAAAYAPDTVATAVGFTTSAATAGAGVLAVAGVIAVASPPPSAGRDDAVRPTTPPSTYQEVQTYREVQPLGDPAPVPIGSTSVPGRAGAVSAVGATVAASDSKSPVTATPSSTAPSPTTPSSMTPPTVGAPSHESAPTPHGKPGDKAGHGKHDDKKIDDEQTKAAKEGKAAGEGKAAKEDAKAADTAAKEEAKAADAAAKEEAKASDAAAKEAAKASDAAAKEEAKARDAAAAEAAKVANDEAKAKGHAEPVDETTAVDDAPAVDETKAKDEAKAKQGG